MAFDSDNVMIAPSFLTACRRSSKNDRNFNSVDDNIMMRFRLAV